MPRKSGDDRIDLEKCRNLLTSEWEVVSRKAEEDPSFDYVVDAKLRKAIVSSVNHAQVAYRFCLPTQLLGKLSNPNVNCLALQRGKVEASAGAWDARSLASKVVAPFNLEQENVLGTSSDPYVGNAMRIPRMRRDDKSKKDLKGWNVLIDVLEAVEKRRAPSFTESVFRQVLLEIWRRQGNLRFTYSIPPRVSLGSVLDISSRFLSDRSGGDRALTIAAALFDVVAARFQLFATVKRGRINASDAASGQAADLECFDTENRVVMVVEVKDRALTVSDVEGTLTKARRREIRDIFFAAPQINAADEVAITERIERAFAAGQNLYHFDTLALARAVLALAGEPGRHLFLKRVGEHLDAWSAQPRHRQAWKSLLESL